MEGDVLLNKNEQFVSKVIEDFRAGRSTRKAAAFLLGVTERTISNLAKRVRLLGVAGIKHGNSNKLPSNRHRPEIKKIVLALAAGKYRDFNIQHAMELIFQNEGHRIGYATFWRWCHEAKIRKPKKRRKAKHHVYRERMANEGLLLQMDGSHHKWNGKDEWCLISAIDDATSNIPYTEFFAGETTWNCMTVLRRIIETRGIPRALYVDRAGWAGGGKRQFFSHFVEACEALGISVIPAYSPQAKGRIERSFKTFQDRLIPEMALYQITKMKDANRYLQQVFIKEYWNISNTVEPREKETRYRALAKNLDLNQIFCKKTDRQIRNDLTFHFDGKLYLIKKPPDCPMKGKHLEIREYPDGSWRPYFGGEVLEYSKVVLPTKKWLLAK